MNYILIATAGILLLSHYPKVLETITPNWLLRLIRPELDDIVGVFNKTQTKLAKFVEREEQAIAAHLAQIEVLQTTADSRTLGVDTAKRVAGNLKNLVG